LNFASDGALILDVGLTFPAAVLKKAAGNDLNDIGDPISHGNAKGGYDLGIMRERMIRGSVVVEFLGTQRLFGLQTLAFKTFDKAYEESRLIYVDPDRGCFPVRIDLFQSKGPEPVAIGMVTHIGAFSKKRWFPSRSVLLAKPKLDGASAVFFREFKVTHFDPESPIDDSAFSITVPPGYQLQLEGSNWALLATEKEEVYRISELPKLLERLKKSETHWKKVAERRAAALPASEGGRGSYVVTVFAILAISSVAVALFVRAKRKSLNASKQ
jgi:hypothetical protein